MPVFWDPSVVFCKHTAGYLECQGCLWPKINNLIIGIKRKRTDMPISQDEGGEGAMGAVMAWESVVRAQSWAGPRQCGAGATGWTGTF